MVVTNDESISTEEKIKQLVELEEEKRKELEEKKQELEKKKQELEELEAKRKQEQEEAQEEIEEKIEELSLEEKRRFEELEEIRRRREAEAASLEETIAGEEREGRIREVAQPRAYGEAIEEILRGNPGFYEVTNYNVMNRLENLAAEARARPLSETERNFIDLVQQNAERLQRDEFYKNKDTGNYMARELDKIDKINRMIRKRDEAGDYQP
ncbi:MAG TPA: hypothetical protein VJ461_05510 [Candidatus Nanoarchaeia archaeon]|nr:hypothetical protein [Candidatus Nanoarchaeia archaeon]